MAAIPLAVAIGGCGKAVVVGGAGAGTGSPAARHAAPTVAVALGEYRLRPDLIVSRSRRITFLVRNLGLLTHDLAVVHRGRRIAASPLIAPGGRSRLRVRLRPGIYELISSVQDDQALGVRGQLRVLAGAR